MGLGDVFGSPDLGFLTRDPTPAPEYGTPSPELQQQYQSGGLTGALARQGNPAVWDPQNSALGQWAARGASGSPNAPLTSPLGPGGAQEILNGPVMGIFAGVNSKTADLAKLAIAKDLAAKGADNEAIRQATGWFKGMGDKWMYEIDDSGMRLGEKGLFGFKESGPVYRPEGKAGKYIDHKDLFAAYPQLKDVNLDVIARGNIPLHPEDLGGYYNPSENKIMYRASSVDGARSGLGHELSHKAQELEGFPRGGSAELMDASVNNLSRLKLETQRDNILNSTEYRKLQSELNMAKARASMEARDEAIKHVDGDLVYQDLYSKMEKSLQDSFNAHPLVRQADELLTQVNTTPTAFDLYRNLAGEIQARDVSARMNLTPEQRLATPPDLRPDAIIRYGSTPGRNSAAFWPSRVELERIFTRNSR